ncbi:hypothetical protein IAU60_005302 [Kwoniella sp. DSM 27419]
MLTTALRLGFRRTMPFRSDHRSLSDAVKHVSSTPQAFTLVRSTARWPLPPAEGASKSANEDSDHTAEAGPSRSTPIHIAILDSSFNPPTTAHQSIAFSDFPPVYSPLGTGGESSGPSAARPATSSNSQAGSTAIGHSLPGYTARLLLFSARNVEKTLDPTHATPEQRIEMMGLMLPESGAGSSLVPDNETTGGVGGPSGSSSLPSAGTAHTGPGYAADGSDSAYAVGLINEPTFVGKASIIRDYLNTLPHLRGRRVDLTFLVGTDTLVRFFDPRFYPQGEMEGKIREYFTPYPEGSGAHLVSARRGESDTDRALEDEVCSRDGVRKWVEAGKVRILGRDGHDGWEGVSSTRVREAIKRGDWQEVDGLVGGEIAKYLREQGLYA